MSRIDQKGTLRIIDANYNRAKEGLRVCEDICRFIYGTSSYTASYKQCRHRLTAAISQLKLGTIIKARDIEGDVGKKTTSYELKRKKPADIFYANSQRVKESVRVLEEFTKLLKPVMSKELKALRYDIYNIEKKISGKL